MKGWFLLALAFLALGCRPSPSAPVSDFKPPKNEGKSLLISRGGKVELKDYLVKGKYTLFEFYADW